MLAHTLPAVSHVDLAVLTESQLAQLSSAQVMRNPEKLQHAKQQHFAEAYLGYPDHA